MHITPSVLYNEIRSFLVEGLEPVQAYTNGRIISKTSDNFSHPYMLVSIKRFSGEITEVKIINLSQPTSIDHLVSKTLKEC